MIIEDEVVYTSEYIDKLYHDEFDQIVELAISEGYVTATKEVVGNIRSILTLSEYNKIKKDIG